MLESADYLHQFITFAIAATVGSAKRLTVLHCMHSSRVSLLLLLVFAAIAAFSCYRALSQKVRHKVGHAIEVARHAGRSLFMLMGGARRKERLASSFARKDVTGARC